MTESPDAVERAYEQTVADMQTPEFYERYNAMLDRIWEQLVEHGRAEERNGPFDVVVEFPDR